MHNLELDSDLANNTSDMSSDSDICDFNEIGTIFTQVGSLCEWLISSNNYILHISATSGNESNVAAVMSNSSCEVLKLSNQQITCVTTFTDHNVIDCKFSEKNDNLIYTGSSDGSIKLWDIRTPKKSVIDFIDTTVESGKVKVFSCFDTSSNERLICAGTELFEGDAFLLFWDIRNHELLGGYWESHTDDITQVKFHPEDKDRLLSGSTDGLINIYDLSQSNEEDALMDSLNTQSSVDRVLWFNENRKNNISCITHTSDLQLWNLDLGEPYQSFTRANISKEIKKKKEDFTYIANVHNAKDHLLLLAGSNFGDGECLRSLNIEQGKTEPAYNFKNNKQRVRSSWYNPNLNVLLTGGENGILNVWELKYVK